MDRVRNPGYQQLLEIMGPYGREAPTEYWPDGRPVGECGTTDLQQALGSPPTVCR